MKVCPHCGSEYGFFRVTYMKGKGITNYKFPDHPDASVDDIRYKNNDLAIDNTELHDCLTYRENKTAFCIECGNPIKELRIK